MSTSVVLCSAKASSIFGKALRDQQTGRSGLQHTFGFWNEQHSDAWEAVLASPGMSVWCCSCFLAVTLLFGGSDPSPGCIPRGVAPGASMSRFGCNKRMVHSYKLAACRAICLSSETTTDSVL